MIHSRSLLHPRDEILQVMQRIYRYRMTTTSGGNISIRDHTGDIWITPAGIDKGSLRREDIVCVRADGSTDGHHRPHPNSPFIRPSTLRVLTSAAWFTRTVWRWSPSALPGRCRTHGCFIRLARCVGKSLLLTYALPGSQALADSIVRAFASGPHCVVLENHGVVVGDTTLQGAFERFETLEFTAKTIIKGRMLGPVQYLLDEQIHSVRKLASVLPEFVPASATVAEKELRRQLCAFLRRGYRNRLMISTEGSFSAWWTTIVS